LTCTIKQGEKIKYYLPPSIKNCISSIPSAIKRITGGGNFALDSNKKRK
jgi:hypothetical protein